MINDLVLLWNVIEYGSWDDGMIRLYKFKSMVLFVVYVYEMIVLLNIYIM